MTVQGKHLAVAMVATAIISIGTSVGFVHFSRDSLPPTAAEQIDHEPTIPDTGDDGQGEPKPRETFQPKDEGADAARVSIEGGKTFVKLVKKLKMTVVHISTSKNFTSSPLYHWHPNNGRRTTGLGTGTIIDSDGLILTNNHVIQRADLVMVRLADERQFRAKVVGRDPDTDLALIKIDSDKPLTYAPLGDSSLLEIGETVVAIGNPFGLDHTVTAGIVSAKGRRNIAPGGKQSPYWNFIQTDASINPGNSGGPLININGKVVGINTAIDSRGAGIGFAIPINMAKVIIPLLKKHGRAPRSYLGVAIQPVTKSLKRSLQLPSLKGALVAEVVPNSPAEKAGIISGDVITKFGDRTIEKASDLPWLAATEGIGKKVKISLIRGGKSYSVEAVLAAKDPRDDPDAKTQKKQYLGLTLRALTPEMARVYGLSGRSGVIITNVKPSSPGAMANLERGEIILQVGPMTISTPEQFRNAVRKADRGQDIPLLVTSTRGTRWVIVPKM